MACIKNIYKNNKNVDSLVSSKARWALQYDQTLTTGRSPWDQSRLNRWFRCSIVSLRVRLSVLLEGTLKQFTQLHEMQDGQLLSGRIQSRAYCPNIFLLSSPCCCAPTRSAWHVVCLCFAVDSFSKVENWSACMNEVANTILWVSVWVIWKNTFFLYLCKIVKNEFRWII